MSENPCPDCGAHNPEDAAVCHECGKPLLEQVEDCLDVANPDTTCNEDENKRNRALIYSILIIVALIVVVTLILSFAPSAYWG
ncbi:MAG: zinc-ribbon domain-containing protein [Methanobacterium sp.]|nr:zinc-ribbon domain-containing protein [Methanobacterium sp.]